MTETKPRPPTDLGSPGRAYWRSVANIYELNVDELLLLRQTCKLLDSIADYDARIEEDGLIVAGAEGQPRPHPLVPQRRADQRLLASLVSQLGLPDEAGAVVPSALSTRGRKAAQSRWARDPYRAQREARRGTA